MPLLFLPPPSFSPHRTRVAILPVAHVATALSPGMRGREATRARYWTTGLFTQRGFLTVPEDEVDVALASAGARYGDSRTYTPTALAAVGRACAATLVTFTSLDGVEDLLMRDGAEGRVWLVVCKSGEPILDGVRLFGRPKVRLARDLRRLSSVEKLMEGAFAEFLVPYPKVGPFPAIDGLPSNG